MPRSGGSGPDKAFGVYRKAEGQSHYHLVALSVSRQRAEALVKDFIAEGKVGGWYVTDYHGRNRL